MEWNVIIFNKNNKYELADQLPIDARLKKISKLHFSNRAILYMKSYVFLKYRVNGCSYHILRWAMLYAWPGVKMLHAK